MRLLVIEDTLDVADAIASSLSRQGMAVDQAASLAEAFALLEEVTYDVVVLDMNLPDGSGSDILAWLRRQRRVTGVLVVTARFAVEERVKALDGGADDYLVKPFDLRELQARVRALARRPAVPERRGILEYGDLAFDPAERALTVAGAPVALTPRELSLLEVLLLHRGRVVPKERIFSRMFAADDEEVGLNAVETYVARLRRKLAGSSVAIKTLRGLGYQLLAGPQG
ncbi:response regulator transcription factor [Afifella pfennigii]|uniref:response regulator transcription factor n=1 Tax=Afifella pfennigii TaxID=209897 RepID=UPI000479E93D|nr:response regulator transcription factor [Afifella pfennigii]